MLRRRILAALAAVAALAFPATSLAQSAGDEQYVDPIPGHTGGGGSSGSDGSDGSSGSSGSSGSTGTTPATPSTPPAPTTAGTTTTPSADPAAATSSGELPRTGFDVIVTIELGLAMLLTGLVSRRMLTLRERRDHR